MIMNLRDYIVPSLRFKNLPRADIIFDCGGALQDNFDYNWSMQVVYSHNMTEEEWQELVYNELAEGKPFFKYVFLRAKYFFLKRFPGRAQKNSPSDPI